MHPERFMRSTSSGVSRSTLDRQVQLTGTFRRIISSQNAVKYSLSRVKQSSAIQRHVYPSECISSISLNTFSSGGFLNRSPHTGFEQKSQENGQPRVTIRVVCLRPPFFSIAE